MVILGIHFGHDANICVLRDGVVRLHYIKERFNRVRHCVGIDYRDVETALRLAGLDVKDVDYCAVTSTQGIEYLFFEPDLLSFSVLDEAPGEIPAPLLTTLAGAGANWRQLPGRRGFYGSFHLESQRRCFAQYADRDLGSIAFHPSMESFAGLKQWQRRTLQDIATADHRPLLDDRVAKAFHLPIEVKLGKRRVFGALLSHHYAHAAYAFFQSPFASAAILTHDGGQPFTDYDSGMLYYGDGVRLYPLSPHYLPAGYFYDAVSTSLGLGDEFSAPGKMMGLAAYGAPRFFDQSFIGNWFDAPRPEIAKQPSAWWQDALRAAARRGYDMAALGIKERMTEAINADLAASGQRMFEETMLAGVQALARTLDLSECATDRLAMAGGSVLNCPFNSRVFNETAFREVFVPPAVDDSGLGIGSALALYHAILEQPRPAPPSDPTACAYFGGEYGEAEIEAALSAHAATIVVDRPDNPAELAARDLFEDRIIGWFEGRSEIGPRALGHRSILAHPAHEANWLRVNKVKRREAWRPFAPAVLAQATAGYFSAAPDPSPFMLFNARVVSDAIPAVKHVDGTARIQSVTAAAGCFFELIGHFERLSGLPLVMNTSFNGPGEPIVESPRDALDFFAGSDLDALYIQAYRIRHRLNADPPAGRS
jgi:carbamoyltransferase